MAKKFADDYVIGRPYTSEVRGSQGSFQTTDWYDQNGHFVGSETNGSGNPHKWEGKTHAEYMAAIQYG